MSFTKHAVVAHRYLPRLDGELIYDKTFFGQLIGKTNAYWCEVKIHGVVRSFPSMHVEDLETWLNRNQGNTESQTVAPVSPPAEMQPSSQQQQQVSAPRASLEVVVALYSFDASSSDELSFTRGERLGILTYLTHSDYCEARNSQGVVGLVPRNYIKMINPSSSTAQDFAPQYSGKPKTLMEQEPWFFGHISRDRAEDLLHHGREGEFLVRDSESNPGDLSISIRGVGRIDHFNVQNVDGQLKFGNRKFMNMKALITHYTTNPILSFPTAKLYLTGPLPK